MIGKRTRIAEVLARKCGHSIAMIRRLHEKLGIAAEVLIQSPRKCEAALTGRRLALLSILAAPRWISRHATRVARDDPHRLSYYADRLSLGLGGVETGPMRLEPRCDFLQGWRLR